MKVIFTDENIKLKELGNLIDSKDFHDYIILKRKFMSTQKIVRLKKHKPHELAKLVLNKFFETYQLFITDISPLKTDKYNQETIVDYNAFYVQDLNTKEIIGLLHLEDVFGSFHFYATDIHNNFVSNQYYLPKTDGVYSYSIHVIDWSQYLFKTTE